VAIAAIRGYLVPMRALLLCLSFLLACPAATDPDSAEDPVVPLEPPADGSGFQLAMSGTAPANSESWLCSVYPMPTDALANVNWVEFQQNPGMHHMTLSTLGIGVQGEIPYGEYDCSELYGDASLMENQVMFFGSQGGEGLQEMHLPLGVAAQMPPTMDVIHEVHFVNVTEEPIELYSRVNAYTISDGEVDEGIWGGQVRDETITIPAESDATEWTRCVMNVDVDVLFLASHTHRRGIDFTIRRFDGTTSGDIFYSNDDWHDPKIVQYDPPLVIPAGEGFEYACTWRNTDSFDVNYGLTAEDEMCNLAIVHTPFDQSARCEVVETSDGVIWEP
jgi:hypothetical protein